MPWGATWNREIRCHNADGFIGSAVAGRISFKATMAHSPKEPFTTATKSTVSSAVKMVFNIELFRDAG